MTRRAFAMVLLVAAAAGVVLLRLLIGRAWDGGQWSIELGWPDPQVLPFRLNAVASAGIVGMSLGLSGLFLQVLLRNPLASPFVLGISSGASLGIAVSLAASIGLGVALPAAGTVVPAFVGAMATLAAVSLAGRRRGGLDPLTLVLAGVVVSSLCGALLLVVHHLLPVGVRGDLITWTMGRIDERPEPGVLAAGAAVLAAGLLAGMLAAKALDVAGLGEEEAISVGLAISRLRWLLLAAAGLLAASAVAIAGPIGFIGLIAPHAARLLVGVRHRLVVPATALCGVVLLVGADAARQPIDFGAGRLPVGVLTALLGGPAFLWLLHRGRLEGWS
jgi:iron complex transport system permease protein